MADEGKRNGLPSEGLQSGIPTQVLKRRYFQASPSPPKMKNGPEDMNDTTTSISPAGSNTSSSSRELRSEEAELAAVIAKVTGRASPFVNEFDGGKRKFTILCGDAANASELPEGTTSFTNKDTFGNKDFLSSVPSKIPSENYKKPRIVGVEMKKTFGDGSSVPVEHDGSKISNDLPVKAKLNRTFDVIRGVSNNSSDDTLPGEGKSTLIDSKTATKSTALNGKPTESTDQIPQGNNAGPMNVADTINTGNEDHKNRKVAYDLVNIDNSQVKVDSETVQDSKTESKNSKVPDSMSLKENAPVKGKDGPTKAVSNLDTGKVKAIFPINNSVVRVKSYDKDRSEIEQNVINRRMAARNATAIAEFDPLVTMSPEAKKLAMWSTVNPPRKFMDGLDELVYNSSTDSPVRSSEIHVKTPNDESFKNVQDNLNKEHPTKLTTDPSNDNEGFAKGTDKQTDLKTPLDKLPSKNILIIKSISGKDGGELGDDGSAKGRSIFRSSRWMVFVLLLIVVSISILVTLMIFGFNLQFFYNSGSDITDGVIHVEQYETPIGQPEGLIDMFQEDGFLLDKNLNTAELESIYEVLPGEEDFAEEIDFHSSTGKFKGKEFMNPLLNGDGSLKGNSKPTRQSVCSSLDSKVAGACGKIKPLLLKLLFKSILLCQESEDILMPGYIQMYRYLNSFLSSFGGFAAVQTRMLEDRVNQLESYTLGDQKLDYHKLFKMVYFEVASGSINNTDPFSATILFTCLHRHLQYLALTLEYILTIHPDQSLQLAFDTAYEKTLAKHHTWIVKSIYDVGMNMLPTKNRATLLLSIRQVEKVAIPELEESLSLVISELTILNDLGESILNQTDVFSVIPEQVIT
ncbi:uncharacterized protein [Palaemon carinicauda]|uniref:uncharacterized protein n=1 Tax=Palaemon carinicauda TaxID=392227 RepID=UPI0035B63A4E